MKLRALNLFVITFLIQQASAQVTESDLKSPRSFVGEPARIANDLSLQSNQLVKKALNGKDFSIPKTWRLVSVVPGISRSSGSSEYVLFFQDSGGSVHSLGINMDGSITGNNIIQIPSY